MYNFEREQKKKQYRLLLAILLLIFLVVLGYTIYWEVRYYTYYNHFEKTTAEVVGHEIKSGQKRDVLQYYVNGSDYKSTTPYESKNEIGDKIIVYFDVDNPMGIIFSRDYRRYVLPILSAMFGAVFVCFCFLYKISFPKPKLELEEDE